MTLILTDAEDTKLLTLARAQRGRHLASAEGRDAGAVRDTDGRTYTASAVDLGDRRLSALQLAVAMAASSGVFGLEAALVVTESDRVDAQDLDVIRHFGGAGVPIYRADPGGVVHERITS